MSRIAHIAHNAEYKHSDTSRTQPVMGSPVCYISAFSLIHNALKKGQGKRPHRYISAAQDYRARFKWSLPTFSSRVSNSN